MENIKTHYRTCNLCEAMCGLEIEHSNGDIISIKGDKKDVFSKGHICPKAVALEDLYHDKDRLKTPLKRTDSGWEEISWKEAFDEVATKQEMVALFKTLDPGQKAQFLYRMFAFVTPKMETHEINQEMKVIPF